MTNIFGKSIYKFPLRCTRVYQWSPTCESRPPTGFQPREGVDEQEPLMARGAFFSGTARDRWLTVTTVGIERVNIIIQHLFIEAVVRANLFMLGGGDSRGEKGLAITEIYA